MSTETQMTPKTADTEFEPFKVNVRIKISALWAAMLFVFAYVDIFSLFRPDFRADVEAGVVGGFTVNQTFLLVTTIYIAHPQSDGVWHAGPATKNQPNRQHRIGHHLCDHDHRRGRRRVELLRIGQRRRDRTPRGHRPLRADLAESQRRQPPLGIPGPAADLGGM